MEEEKTPESRPVRKGRPKKEKPQNTFNVVPQEEHYLGVTDKYLPFSNSIRADQYLKLKRLEYHSKQSIRVILEAALGEYLDKQPKAKKKLPETEAAKLKPLKTALDYYYNRQED